MARRFLTLLLVAAGLSACETPVETLKATAYSEIVRAQMAAGDPAGAMETAGLALQSIDEDDDDGSRNLTIAAAAVAQVRAGDLAGAEETLRRAKSLQMRGLVHTVLALAMAEAGHKRAARHHAGMAGSSAVAIQPDEARARSLALAAWAKARSGDMEGAWKVKEKIVEAGMRDEATALIAWAQAEAGDAAGALVTLKQVESPGSDGGDMEVGFMTARGIAIDVYDVFDDLFLYAGQSLQNYSWHATALAFAGSGDMKGAQRAFDESINAANTVSNPDRRLNRLAATGLVQAEAGDRKSALVTLDYADSILRQIGSNADEVSRETVRTIDAVRSAIDGQVIFTSDSDPNDTAEFLIQIAIYQIRLKDPDGASTSLDRVSEFQSELREPSLLVAGHGRLAVARLEAGDATRAQRRATQALEIARGIPKTDEDRIIAMFFAAVALARTGNIEDALTAAAEIQEKEEPAQ